MDSKKDIIGTLNEHTLHLAMKNYCEPDKSFHEQKYKGFVADIRRGNTITEIQTRSFNNLRRKLDAFLTDNVVTVVYPIAAVKWIIWTDPQSGEISDKHKSPKKGKTYEAFYELYKIKQYITDPNFRFKVIMADIEEYKALNGWSKDRKRGATRTERLPVGFKEVIDVTCPAEYSKLAPDIPDGEFTSKMLAETVKITQKSAWYTINVLCAAGVLEVCGKSGRAVLYRKSQELF